jgi:hypothetical protein
VAQEGEAAKYTDPDTKISFNLWGIEAIHDEETETMGQGAYHFGMALPPDALTNDATEYIGYLVSAP